MNIELENIGKKFRNEWIFRELNYKFKSGGKYAITGPNGSGKSTLLQIIAGLIPANLGSIIYRDAEKTIDMDEAYQYLQITAPYIEIIEEYTLDETLDFHLKFKPFNEGLSKNDFFEILYLKDEITKPIQQFSSGMKQRLKLGLAFLTKSEVVFLDEPTTNLDEQGINWYLDMVLKMDEKRTILISSNDKKEYKFCDDNLNVSDFKSR